MQQQNRFVDLYQTGVKTAADVAKMSLENSIRLQEKQFEIVRGALDEQARAVGELAGAKSMEEMLALQSRMASAQLGRAVEFWSSLWQAAAENHSQGLRDLQSVTTRTSEDVVRAASSQIARAAGTVQSGNAANGERKADGQRKSA
ncbi:MAG TPA: phasin family protein [Burkholderiales bacterium]|nr:phasin family protein [Burkholderiales bacterium]